MTYYLANSDTDAVICDDCGEQLWKPHPKYGTNVDSREAYEAATGERWKWVPVFASVEAPCRCCRMGVK